MSGKTSKLMTAFIIGQILQIILHILAKAWWMNHPVLFCVCSGFLITMAVVVGITLAGSEKKARPKTYSEWAEQENLHEES